MNSIEELRASGLSEVLGIAGVTVTIGSTSVQGLISEEIADAQMDENGFVLSSKLRNFVLPKSGLPSGLQVAKGKKLQHGGKTYQIDSITEDAVSLTLGLKA